MIRFFLIASLSFLISSFIVAQDFSWAGKAKDGTLTVDVTQVKGAVLIAGSGTVYPLGSAIIDQFKAEGFAGQATYDNIGSGAGFKRFAAGEIDISSASVAIDDATKKAVADLGKGDLLEFKIALDALVIIVNGKNVAKNLTADQVKALFSTAVLWSDVDKSWPAEKIIRFIPETSHGTFTYFVEKFFGKKADPVINASNTQRFQDYNLLISAIEKEKYGIGFIGYDYYKESDSIVATTLDSVSPTKENVLTSKYGLSRYLYLYTTTGIIKSKPQVAGFLTFFLNSAGKYTTKLGFFSLPADILLAQKKQLIPLVK
jgi:phosphate transport system substrate-binding protein